MTRPLCVLRELHEQSPVPVLRPSSPRNVGLFLVGVGTFAVSVAAIQHWKYIRKLSPGQADRRWDLALIVAILIALPGFLIFTSMVYTGGPFG